MIFDRNIH